MADWWLLNSDRVELTGIEDQIKVSSWACVIDVYWKQDFAPVRTDGAAPESAAPYTYQSLGSTGDTIGIYLKQKSFETVDQGALLLRSTVTTEGVNASTGVSAVA